MKKEIIIVILFGIMTFSGGILVGLSTGRNLQKDALIEFDRQCTQNYSDLVDRCIGSN